MKPRRTPANRRRRPRQSRALHTARALQEAFVRLLVEKDYADVTIREIVALAGTGLGSFYEYFASKQDLARVSLHLRTKSLLLAQHAAVAQHAGQPLDAIVDAVVAAQLAAHGGPPEEWTAHYLLERHHSDAAAYRKMYERFIGAWMGAFDAAGDLPPHFPRREAAQVCQAILYGLFAHAYLSASPAPDRVLLARQARTALHAYLGSVRGTLSD